MSWLPALTSYAWAGVFVSVCSVALTLYGMSRQKPVEPSRDTRLLTKDAPFVSVLVPVRNEEHRVLRESIHSILAQDYSCFEVIALNDLSTDASGSILKEIGNVDARLRVVEGSETPAGWLGKPHAMQQALQHARGDWLLATDADMIFDKTALRTAMARLSEEQADALTLIPHLESYSFWERVVIPAWAWVLLMVFLLYRVNSPRSSRALGFGGFFLVRRTALERAGGYEALKDEVAEDFRLAENLKRSGARLRVEFAPRLTWTRMYTNFREMWECHAKNWFAGANYSLPLAVASSLLVYLIAVVPPVLAVVCVVAVSLDADAGDFWRMLLPAAIVWLLQVFLLALFNRRFRVPPAYALLTPLGLAVLYAILLDSGLRITLGRGVTWKGRRVYEGAGVRPPRIGKRSSMPSDVD